MTDDAGVARAKPEFVGRDSELGAVVRALNDPPALILIEGEAGIGKTRLLHEALASSADRTVLLAACPPLHEPFPLGAIVDGIRRLRPDIAGLGLSPLGGALRPLFPEWSGNLPPTLESLEDPKETRQRLFAALTELTERLGIEILVVEDVHWADTATLEWLLTLTASEPVDGRSRVIAVSYRPWDVPDGSLLPRLTSRSPTGMPLLRAELGSLDVHDIRRLVGSMFGAENVSEQFAQFLHQRADGVPLAVEEILMLLRDREDIFQEDGRWNRRVLGELEIPATVRDSVLERVSRLNTDTRRLLDAAAVVAGPADEPLLAIVAGLDDDAARRGVAQALGSGLLQERSTARFTFRHALDAEAIGGAIPVSERRRMHHRAGEALMGQPHPPLARLARHFREAGDTERWCQFTEAATDLALESGDDRNTVVMLLEVITAAAHPADRRARLARKLGEVAALGAAPPADLGPAVIDVLRIVAADTEMPVDQRGAIRFLLGRLLMQRGELEAAFSEFESAVPDLEARPALASRAMLYLALPVVRAWPVSRHLAWLERAAELLPRIDAGPERLSFSVWHAIGLLFLGEESGWQAAEKIPSRASTERELREITNGALNFAQSAMVWGRYDDARQRLSQAAELAASTGFARGEDVAKIANAHVNWYIGAWQGLDRALAELGDDEQAQPTTRLEARLLQGLLQMAGGSRSTAEKCFNEVLSVMARRGQVEPFFLPSPGLARLRLADGDVAGALLLTEKDIELIGRKAVWIWATDIAPVHVDALVAAARVDDADDLVHRFGEGLTGRNAPAPAAALLTCRGIVAHARGDLNQAANLFVQAATAWAALPRPYDELITLERQGRCLLDAGHREEALEVLSNTQERLAELGAKWDADRVAQLLRRHGVDVARTWRRGPKGYGDQLSPRELEVVELIARGMSNPQVAEALFLSRKTVERHVHSAMRKLSVSSRTAMAVAAAEAGLIRPNQDEAGGHWETIG